jgi:hypothetical protein
MAAGDAVGFYGASTVVTDVIGIWELPACAITAGQLAAFHLGGTALLLAVASCRVGA